MADHQMIHIELTDNSGLVKDELEAAALRALEKCGLAAEKYAKLLCEGFKNPSGNLRSSITHQVQPSEMKVYIGTNVEYGPYVELGTGKYYPGGRQTPWVYQDAKGDWHLTHGQRAQPYLKPAVADHKAQYRSIIEGELKNG